MNDDRFRKSDTKYTDAKKKSKNQEILRPFSPQ